MTDGEPRRSSGMRATGGFQKPGSLSEAFPGANIDNWVRHRRKAAVASAVNGGHVSLRRDDDMPMFRHQLSSIVRDEVARWRTADTWTLDDGATRHARTSRQAKKREKANAGPAGR
ncbi:hypothetical protein HJFPF1_01783 [Paramyrothecium foliicola]|nr:hypothetical protein HJFPF1_01783 [Paramyrothecium foliicola]